MMMPRIDFEYPHGLRIGVQELDDSAGSSNARCLKRLKEPNTLRGDQERQENDGQTERWEKKHAPKAPPPAEIYRGF